MMKMAAAVVLAAICCAGPLHAQAPRRIEEIVARVNGQIILKSELDKEYRQLADDLKRGGAKDPEEFKKLYDEMSKVVLRNLIDVTLLMQVAKEQGVDGESCVVKRLYDIQAQNKFATMDEMEKIMREQGISIEEVKDNLRRDCLTQEVINREVASRIVVSTEEMKKHYEENKDDFKHDAGVKIGDLGVSTLHGAVEEQRKKIEEAYAALKAGMDFAEAAKKYSERPSAERGGEVGFVDEADLPGLDPIIGGALAKMEKGQISEILTMPDGFLILKALDKHTGGVLSFELAQNEIYGVVITKRLPAKVREYLDKLREDGFVDVREGYVDNAGVKKTERVVTTKGKKN